MSEQYLLTPFEDVLRANAAAAQNDTIVHDTITQAIHPLIPLRHDGSLIHRYHAYLTEVSKIELTDIAALAEVPMEVSRNWRESGLDIVAPLVFIGANTNGSGEVDLRISYANYRTGKHFQSSNALLGKIAINHRTKPGKYLRNGVPDYFTIADKHLAVHRLQAQIHSDLVAYAPWKLIEPLRRWPKKLSANQSN